VDHDRAIVRPLAAVVELGKDLFLTTAHDLVAVSVSVSVTISISVSVSVSISIAITVTIAVAIAISISVPVAITISIPSTVLAAVIHAGGQQQGEREDQHP
jgi:hypothetical protein